LYYRKNLSNYFNEEKKISNNCFNLIFSLSHFVLSLIRMMVVEFNSYTYCIPYVLMGETGRAAAYR